MIIFKIKYAVSLSEVPLILDKVEHISEQKSAGKNLL
jgi:hypothetical protein